MSDRLPECLRQQADVVQGLLQRRVPQLDLDLALREVGIEEDIDAGELADGFEDDSGVFVQH